MHPDPSVYLNSGVGVIAILLITIWGAFSGAMNPYAALNAIKQEIMGFRGKAASDDDIEYLRNRLANDWRTMNAGTAGFLGIITLLLLALAYLVHVDGNSEQFVARLACLLTATLPGYGVYVNVWSVCNRTRGEYWMMHSLINDLEAEKVKRSRQAHEASLEDSEGNTPSQPIAETDGTG
jgi:hypothetical protein